MPEYQHLSTPTDGASIEMRGNELFVPDAPIIPFIEGDGTGPDIWRASQRVFDAAVEKAYGGSRRIVWFEVFAGEKAHNRFSEWLPEDTLTAIREHLVAIKGPLTPPLRRRAPTFNGARRQQPAS